MKDVLQMDAIGQAQLIEAGKISITELFEATIRNIEELEPKIAALAFRAFDQAKGKLQSLPKGPFRGVPFLIKDLLPYPGQICAMGSRLFTQNRVPAGTPYTQKIDESGLLTIGKTTTSEFGLLGSTETLLHGITRNPWNEAYSATGSSGGSAAAVASGMVPLAHASDGGGSIRIPASVCGLFGFKPSARRVFPTQEVNPDFQDLLAEHCVSKSVRDSAYFLAATEQTGDNAHLPPLDLVKGPLTRKLKIGWYAETLMGEQPTDGVAQALQKTIGICRELGHEVIPVDAPPVDGRAISDAFFTIAGKGMYDMTQMLQGMIGRPVGSEDLEPFTLELIEWYLTLPPHALEQARQDIQASKQAMRTYVDKYDVLLCPTLPMEPVKLGYLSPTLGREELLKRTEKLAGYTPIHNMAGIPAMSVPLHINAEGLPIGSHFAAPYGQEKVLLELAYQLEEAAPWKHTYPK